MKQIKNTFTKYELVPKVMKYGSVGFMSPHMSVGMFVASYLFSVENCEIAIFSTGRRASQKLLELIHSLVCKLPGGRERIAKYNAEILNMKNCSGPQTKTSTKCA